MNKITVEKDRDKTLQVTYQLLFREKGRKIFLL